MQTQASFSSKGQGTKRWATSWVFFASLLFTIFSALWLGGGVAVAQSSNDYYQQQRQQQQQQMQQQQRQQQQQQMQEQQRQQMQDQMRQQQRQQMQDQMRQQQRQQMQDQMRQQQRQQMQDQMRQQQRQQMQSQMQQQQRQQMQDQMRQQQRQQMQSQMQQQQRQQMQTQMQQQQRQQAQAQMQQQQRQQQQQMQQQQRQQAQTQLQQRQQMQAQQKQQQDQQRQQQQKQQLQDQQKQQQRQQALNQQKQQQDQQRQQQGQARVQQQQRQAQALRAQQQRVQIQEAKRPPTAGEIQKGFTGKVTADGRALVKFKNRILAVPASRISGLTAKLIAQQNRQKTVQWTAQQQTAINQRVTALAGSGNGGNGPGGERYSAANDNLKPKFPNAQHELQYNNAIALARSSKTPVLVLGRYPNYLGAAFYGKSKSFYMSAPDWEKAKASFIKSNPAATDSDVAKHMFETYNKKYIDDHIKGGGRIVLASPYDEMKGTPSYSQMEIKYLESLGYSLSADGTEMLKK